MFEWLFWEQYSHEPYVAVARFQVKYLGKPVADLDPRMVSQGDGRAEAARRGPDRGRTSWSAAGSASPTSRLVAYTRMAHDGGFDLADYPAVKAWIARVEAALPIKEAA